MFDDDYMASRFVAGSIYSLVAIVLLVCYNIHIIKEGQTMDIFGTSLTVLITVFITEVVNLIIFFIKRHFEKKDALENIDEKINKLVPDISDDVTSKVGVAKGGRSITDQIGVKGGEALASRIDKIGVSIEEIGKTITDSTNGYNDKLKKLSKRQREIRDKISDISDVIDDWQRLSQENEVLQAENAQLREQLVYFAENAENHGESHEMQ